MDTAGFRKLRIVVAAGMAGSSVVGGATRALAATQGLPAAHTNGTASSGSSWSVGTNLFASAYDLGGTGYGFNYAGLRGTDTGTSCTPSHVFCIPTFHGTRLEPAFGGTFLLKVGANVYRTPNGVIDVNGNTFTSARKLSGFKVQYRIVFLGNRRAAILYSFKNPKAITKKAKVVVASHMNATNITQTESGDTALGVDDAWFVDTPDDTDSFPVLTMARGNCDGCAQASILSTPTNGNNTWVESYAFKVKPQQTKRLLFYVEMSEDIDPDPQVFHNASSLRTAGLLGAFTPKQRAQVINWKNLG